MAFGRQKWLILSSTSVGVYIVTINTSIVNIALPSIMSYFNTTFSNVEWVVLVYLLLMSSLQLTFGRMGDMYGHKTVYVIGLFAFTAASLLIVFSPTILWLIVFRSLQAVGGSMTIAVVQAILAANFKPGERGQVIGFNALVVSLALATGPVAGGLLLSSYSWQAIFVINIPLGLICTLWAWRILPQERGIDQKFDFPGSLAIFICLMSFLLAMSHGQEWGWRSPLTLSLFAGALFFLGIFIYWETYVEHPMVHLKLFKNRLFAAANAAALLNYVTQYVIIFLMPFYLIDNLQLPTNKAGFIMIAFPLMMMLVSPVSGTLSDRISSRILSSGGMFIIAVSAYFLSGVDAAQTLAPLIAGLSLAGIGTGLFLPPNNNAIMGSVSKEDIGIASGMIGTMRCIGQSLGIAISGAVFTNRMAYHSLQFQTQGLDILQHQGKIFTLAQHDTFLMAMGIAVLGMIVSLVRGSGREQAAVGLEGGEQLKA